jgi:hypothetical protein
MNASPIICIISFFHGLIYKKKILFFIFSSFTIPFSCFFQLVFFQFFLVSLTLSLLQCICMFCHLVCSILCRSPHISSTSSPFGPPRLSLSPPISSGKEMKDTEIYVFQLRENRTIIIHSFKFSSFFFSNQNFCVYFPIFGPSPPPPTTSLQYLVRFLETY